MTEIYINKASQIIKNSIKSAVFIDEKARSFFCSDAKLTGANEEKITTDLFSNFRDDGISLAVHKYQHNDEENEELTQYLFESRDLVLLDWKLAGDTGEESSLKLLSKVVKRSNIHFCVIYTSMSKPDNVLGNILSYFSGSDKEYYKDVKNDLENEKGINDHFLTKINTINLDRDNKDGTKKIIGQLFQEDKKLIDEIIAVTGQKSPKCALIKASIAFMDSYKSETANLCPDIVSYENKSLVINNTIITILNKDENQPDVLINNLTQQIISQKTGFTQLLGLEMKTILSKSGSFIDSNLLQVSKQAFIHHRNNYKKDNKEYLFPRFIKSIMLGSVDLTIRKEQLQLLEPDFLNAIDDSSALPPEELVAMNVFYNAKKLDNNRPVNFGDVFIGEKGEYFICITALCDCLRPEDNDNLFYFAKGTSIKMAKALSLGDTAFVSYLNSENIVKWTDVNNTVTDVDQHKYTPVYVKPVLFKILNPTIDSEGKLNLSIMNNEPKIDSKELFYITTIKDSYTQRIANHAFTHPVRVGVDFVKN
ncbi:response regulator receiver domain [Sulfurimonas sp.]|uniref:response regulator receiver domain n=1 Tax=Sulfurimonas sp. TaxID=2022749 RepID=UPI0025DBC3D7|nr:response regulator receiver domain [Sulfurimonas sp.]